MEHETELDEQEPLTLAEQTAQPKSLTNLTCFETWKPSRLSLNWSARAEGFLRGSRVPALHAQTEPDMNADPKWYEIVRESRAKLGTGMLLAYVGPRGTGKSKAAVSVVKQACLIADRRGETTRRPALYTKTMELFLDVRAAFNKEQAERDAVRPFIECGLLVMDEVQERGGTEWEDRILNYVIDKRYDFQRDTILITNLTTGEFAENVGASIVSRMVEKGKVHTFNIPSFRKPKLPS